MVGNFIKQNHWTEENIEKLLKELDDLCAARWIFLNSHDPVTSLRTLLNWEVSVSLDPAVSQAARDLIQRGRDEQLRDIFGDK